jgi:predicted DsbA family dithiol-disulfide isomerase/2-polyprenyl-6-methoxyphenol hydroxylase-like FAD-dependent oxidoreductase
LKVVIIGSGLAGLATGIILQKNGIQVSINERDSNLPRKGQAFLLHPDAMEVLTIISKYNPDLEIPGQFIDKIVMKRPNHSLLNYSELESWICMKRIDIIKYLNSFFDENKIKFNRNFSHFIYQNEIAIAAVFENGDIEYGDIFIGADGAKSKVRKSIFGEIIFSPNKVRELVGVVNNPKYIANFPDTFTKYISAEKSLAIGMIPCSATELVWFMQFDVNLLKEKDESPESLKELCTNLLKDFPKDVQDLLALNDFSNNFIWYSTDFDLLPSFHKNNIILLGDAAHLALPFTSAGITNALIDAKCFSELILSGKSFEEVCTSFYQLRANDLNEHVVLGRQIQDNFLNPKSETFTIPLISNLSVGSSKKTEKKISLLYFTDPVCSTCWLIQPQLRKISLLYGDYIDIKYHMSGLLPSWNNYDRGIIKQPSDAAEHWKEMAEKYEMPISPDVWIESPLASSFPPSIAIKAAQLQNKIKAFNFHRRIKELLFVESQNISDIDLIAKTAIEVGLDENKLIHDMSKIAKVKFEEDLELANSLGITTLPTLIFSNKFNQEITLNGYQEFADLERVILNLYPEAVADFSVKSAIELFQIYPSMATHEFSFLMGLNKESSEIILEDLKNSGKLQNLVSKSGTIWKLNS